MASKESLFAVLSRQPWWLSVLVAGALFGSAQLFLPGMIAAAIAIPFVGIAFYAGWRQLRAPGATDVEALLARIRNMPWENFSAVISEAYRRDGYAVSEVHKGAIDLKLDKAGRVAIVSCKRWKAAQTGVGPLRDLLEAKDAQDAAECIYVAAGDFTSNARDFAKQKSIRLLHGAALANLIAKVERGTGGWFGFR
ncbi:MAG TPA: restriction endonuclease [Burkholderiales bacterium]|jgi:restriction system protein|nr:restriction endonuclease [Burkholderiales bacterium]